MLLKMERGTRRPDDVTGAGLFPRQTVGAPCFWKPQKSTVPLVCRLGHQDLGTHICYIRLARGTDLTECSCLQKNILDCLTQWERESTSSHLHSGEAKNPGTAHSARLVLKDRGIPGELLVFNIHTSENLGSDVSEE